MPPEHETDHGQLLAEINRKVDLIFKILTGNGTPEAGLIVQVDRLRQFARLLAWALGVFGAVFITSAAVAMLKIMGSIS